MIDVDRELFAARGDGSPDDDIVARHRRALADVIAHESGPAASGGRPASPVAEVTLQRRDPATTWSRPRRWLPAAAAVTAVVLAGTLWATLPDDGPGDTDVAVTDRDPDPDGGVVPAPLCAGPLPVVVSVAGTEQPLEDLGTDAVGQRRWRVTSGDRVVDVAWPVAQRVLVAAGDGVPRGVEHLNGTGIDGGMRISLDGQTSDGRLIGDDWVEVAPVDGTSPATGCEVVELSVRDAGDEPTRFGWDTTATAADEWPIVDVRPLVVARTEAAAAPMPEGTCAGTTREADPAIGVRTQPAEMLDAFLGAGDAPIGAAGFVEVVVDDGRRVYGYPVQDPTGRPLIDRYTATVTVVEGGSGWYVDSWRSGPCV